MKKIVSLILVVIMAFSLMGTSLAASSAGLSNFTKINEYKAGQFADVKATDWFAGSVQKAYELGLVKGAGNGGFNPKGNLSIAESITLAARLHSTYVNDGAVFQQGSVWYQVYADYAIQNDIIAAGQFSDYTVPATRAQFAVIFAAALPSGALRAINSVEFLPDVSATASYEQAVLALYNAGILTGSDEYGTFNPNSNIQRSEVATIVTRMAVQSERKTFTLKKSVRTIYAATAEELLNAIGSDRKIVLTSAYYDLSASDYSTVNVSNPYVEVYDWIGECYRIHGVQNLTIEGNAHIQIANIDCPVLYFSECSNITLTGLTVGHMTGQYTCMGAVTQFDGCSGVTLNNCKLYGCGAYGIWTEHTTSLEVNACKIYSCSYGSITIGNSSNAVVKDTEFFDCDFSGFLFATDSNIDLYNCNIHNITAHQDFTVVYTFNAPSLVRFYNCAFKDNKFDCITNDVSNGDKKIEFHGCTFTNNDGAFEHPTVTYDDNTSGATTGSSSGTSGTTGSTAVQKKSYSTNGYYNCVPVAPDFGAIAGIDPVKVEESDYGCKFFYDPTLISEDALNRYVEAIVHAGFKRWEGRYGDNGILFERMMKNGDDYFVRIFSKDGYFVIDATKSPI